MVIKVSFILFALFTNCLFSMYLEIRNPKEIVSSCINNINLADSPSSATKIINDQIPTNIRIPDFHFALTLQELFCAELAYCSCSYYIKCDHEPYQVTMNNADKLIFTIGNHLFSWDIKHQKCIDFKARDLLFSLSPLKHIGIALSRTLDGSLFIFNHPKEYAEQKTINSLVANLDYFLTVSEDEQYIILYNSQGYFYFKPATLYLPLWEKQLFDNFRPLIAHIPNNENILLSGPSGEIYELCRANHSLKKIHQGKDKTKITSLSSSRYIFLIGYASGLVELVDQSIPYHKKVCFYSISNKPIIRSIPINQGKNFILLDNAGRTFLLNRKEEQLYSTPIDPVDEYHGMNYLTGYYKNDYFIKGSRKEKLLEVWQYNEINHEQGWLKMILIIKLNMLLNQSKKTTLHNDWLTLLNDEEHFAFSSVIKEENCSCPQPKKMYLKQHIVDTL